MSLRLTLAAIAAIAFAGPALAWQAPPPAAEASGSLTEADVEAAADHFESRMDAMGEEIGAALEGGIGDAAQVSASVDAILTRYSPDMDAFATVLERFLNQQAAAADTPEEAGAMTSAATNAGAAIRALPDYIRAAIAEEMAGQVRQ